MLWIQKNFCCSHLRIGSAHLQRCFYLLPDGLPMPEAAAGGIIRGNGQQLQINAAVLTPRPTRPRFSFCGFPSFTPLYPSLYLFPIGQRIYALPATYCVLSKQVCEPVMKQTQHKACHERIVPPFRSGTPIRCASLKSGQPSIYRRCRRMVARSFNILWIFSPLYMVTFKH